MEFRDALRMFRSEVGVAQTDIATALHVNISTVARWELGKTIPNRSTAVLLLDYAKSKRATAECAENLKRSLGDATKQKLFNNRNGLFAVEHSTISRLIEEAAFPIYVCDLDTDEILYANRATEQKLGKSLDDLAGKKCYECIMAGISPAIFVIRTSWRRTASAGMRPSGTSTAATTASSESWRSGTDTMRRCAMSLRSAGPCR